MWNVFAHVTAPNLSLMEGKKARRITYRYIVFATNLPMGRVQLGILMLPGEYLLRWGIETAYRQIEEVRPWTTSRSATFRMILFFASLFMYNMWAVEHAKRGTDPREATLGPWHTRPP